MFSDNNVHCSLLLSFGNFNLNSPCNFHLKVFSNSLFQLLYRLYSTTLFIQTYHTVFVLRRTKLKPAGVSNMRLVSSYEHDRSSQYQGTFFRLPANSIICVLQNDIAVDLIKTGFIFKTRLRTASFAILLLLLQIAVHILQPQNSLYTTHN